METGERLNMENRRTDTVALRRKINREIRRTEAEFDKHVEKQRCFTDSNGCRDRAAFQERLAALRYVVELLGGRKVEERTTIGDLQ